MTICHSVGVSTPASREALQPDKQELLDWIAILFGLY